MSKIDLLRACALFEDLSDAQLDQLSGHGRVVEVGRDEIIFEQDTPESEVFVLLTGQDGEYDVAGGMWSSDLYLPSRYGIHSGLSKECYCAAQDELLDSKQVMESISF